MVEAYESRREGSYAYGYGYAVVAHHRRPTYAVVTILNGQINARTVLLNE